MSVRPHPGAEVPALTARMAHASNTGGTTAMWVRDRLDGLWRDEDFADWYSRDGRPGLSPGMPVHAGDAEGPFGPRPANLARGRSAAA
jgi:hypothetical protein